MSYCEIIGFKDGKPSVDKEYQNSWGGAPFIWTNLYDTYCKDPNRPHQGWVTDNSNKLWKLAKNKDIPLFMRAVLVSTFDYAIVKKADFDEYSKHLREFVTYFGTKGNVCYLLDWIEFIKENPDIEAIGFYATSVGENLWNEWNSEKEEYIPYDLNQQTKHIDVYEYIKRVDSNG